MNIRQRVLIFFSYLSNIERFYHPQFSPLSILTNLMKKILVNKEKSKNIKNVFFSFFISTGTMFNILLLIAKFFDNIFHSQMSNNLDKLKDTTHQEFVPNLMKITCSRNNYSHLISQENQFLFSVL